MQKNIFTKREEQILTNIIPSTTSKSNMTDEPKDAKNENPSEDPKNEEITLLQPNIEDQAAVLPLIVPDINRFRANTGIPKELFIVPTHMIKSILTTSRYRQWSLTIPLRDLTTYNTNLIYGYPVIYTNIMNSRLIYGMRGSIIVASNGIIPVNLSVTVSYVVKRAESYVPIDILGYLDLTKQNANTVPSTRVMDASLFAGTTLVPKRHNQKISGFVRRMSIISSSTHVLSKNDKVLLSVIINPMEKLTAKQAQQFVKNQKEQYQMLSSIVVTASQTLFIRK